METAKNITVNELNNTFASFLQTKPSAAAVYLPNTDVNKSFTPASPDDYNNKNASAFLEPRKQDKKKFGPLAYVMTGFGLIAFSAGSFFLLNGHSAAFNRFIKKTVNNLEFKISENKHLSKAEDFMTKCRKKIVSFLKVCKAYENFSPMKDMAADKVLKSCGLKGVADWMTGIFKKSHLKYTGARYTKAIKSMDELKKITGEIADEIVKDYKKLEISEEEAIKISTQIKQLADKASSDLSVISQDFTQRRGQALLDLVSGNAKDGWDREIKGLMGDSKFSRFFMNNPSQAATVEGKNFIQRLKPWTEYIPRKIMDKKAESFYAPLSGDIRKITNNAHDLHFALTNSLDDILFSVEKANPAINRSRLELDKLLDSFKDPLLNGKVELRDTIKEKIIKEFGTLQKLIIETDPKNVALTKFEEVFNILKGDAKGSLEEINSVLRDYVPGLQQKYKTAYRATHANIKSAYDGERRLFYGKAVDMELGSIPTDVGGVAIPIGLAGLAYYNSKNKEEKNSVLLKGGIPAVGGVMAAVYANLRQFSGGTGLMFGLATGLILSKIGSIVNNQYMKKQDAKHYA